jgi:hypothetical protein
MPVCTPKGGKVRTVGFDAGKDGCEYVGRRARAREIESAQSRAGAHILLERRHTRHCASATPLRRQPVIGNAEVLQRGRATTLQRPKQTYTHKPHDSIASVGTYVQSNTMIITVRLQATLSLLRWLCVRKGVLLTFEVRASAVQKKAAQAVGRGEKISHCRYSLSAQRISRQVQVCARIAQRVHTESAPSNRTRG